ncbi:endonuclease IV, partial [Halobacillus sp. BBL2006]
KDRHANIFDSGFIKESQFAPLMASDQLENIPFILETPREVVSHKEEIRQLQQTWGRNK